MPATDSEVASMEDPCAVEDEKGSLTDAPSSAPPAAAPAATPPFPTAVTNFTGEAVMESRAVSMASNDCSSALSSPAEASPAKPAVTSPTSLEGTVETSPATSHMESASDSLKCTGTSIVGISESPPPLSTLPSSAFGSGVLDTNFSPALTFKGVTVTLENSNVWKQFHGCGTEMILTKQGRRMFPYCRYRLAGLDPERQYSLVLSILPTDKHKYRWSKATWEVTGPAEHQTQGVIRAFSHHYSPCKGSEWMAGLVSFYKLKLTNNSQDQEGHIILHSMHRYIPKLHVIPVPNGVGTKPNRALVMGPESMTFTFPQTEFMAVTTYQNFRITQLKINHNPFARGFREDGHNSRLHRVVTEAPAAAAAARADALPSVSEANESKEGVVDLSKSQPVPASPSHVQETRLVLKPIMSSPASKDDPYVPCMRGKHSLGELVLVQGGAPAEPAGENRPAGAAPNSQRGFRATPKALSLTPSPSTCTPKLLGGYRKRRKRMNRRWANSRGRYWKSAAAAAAAAAAVASPAVAHSPSLTVALQPELDDVEGLLFVSFTSKEALDVHVGNKPDDGSASVSPVSLAPQKQTEEETPVTAEENVARLEAILLQDLRVLKHRQVIHPVLQEVGLKLSSLDPTKSIDLQYLGVQLPLPPTNSAEQGNAMALSLGDQGLPFISRTGKTSDMTKIKGWRNKFIKSKDASPNCDGLQKNLSAFCSDMLDEYLESEAQRISERAAAFSASPEGSVAYQLPAKSASYVKTLDSALKHRNAASRSPAGVNRPCPLSHKPLLYAGRTPPAPPLAGPEARPSQQPTAQPGAPQTVAASAAAQRSATHHPGASPKPAPSLGQNHRIPHRPTGLTKSELKVFQMEVGALNQGLSRTHLTSERLTVALSVILTKETLFSQFVKVPQYKHTTSGPECGQEFCRLGCVCSSLDHPNRGPLHCRRPECMLGCSCFKRKLTKKILTGGSEQRIQPVYSMTDMEHAVPRPGFHTKKLWNRSVQSLDQEPLFVPKRPQCFVPLKVPRRIFVLRPTPVNRVFQLEEEDKGPVYRYLESLMTCARVRGFNSKPPPKVSIESIITDASAATTSTTTTTTTTTAAKPQKTTKTGDQPKHYYRTLKTFKRAENTCQETPAREKGARKQIQIQSGCQWDKDHKMVLDALCRRMNQNKLSERFSIGPYRIFPVAKIFMQKPSGSVVTYRVRIIKPFKASDNEEDESDDSDEEKLGNKSLDGNVNAEEEDGQTEEAERKFGVTPFLSGVLPAGRLRARTKPVGCQASGLIQVNGKYYNQARLLLGGMGSLHPANRLAAYVTGRLHAPADVHHKAYQKPDPAQKSNTPCPPRIKAAGAGVPQISTARRTSDLKTAARPPAQLQPSSWRKESTTSAVKPVQSFVSNKGRFFSPFQSGPTSSPVSLTVSPSLKTPSFLGQSGTYSFRICPPANQGTKGPKLPGVTLPGGFTLIQLPKPEANEAAQRSGTVCTTNSAGVVNGPPQKNTLLNFGHVADNSDAKQLGLDTRNGGKDPSSSRSAPPGSSPQMKCDVKAPSVVSSETSGRRTESPLDIASEDSSSDFSDYCAEGDEDEELVDIETVEEAGQGMAIARMREAIRKTLQDSRDSSDDFGSARELGIQDETDEKYNSKDNIRRKNHSVLERQRRSEQRTLFDKLQIVLQSDPRAPRLHLLSLALKEIRDLVETSKYLEEQKQRLIQMQSVYVKELSLLSGKPVVLIKHKLDEICNRQKMREKTMKWTPFFSQLLQSRAALLQGIAPKSTPQRMPLLQPDFVLAPPQAKPHAAAAENGAHRTTPLLQPDPGSPRPSSQTPLPAPRSLPRAGSSPTQAEVSAAPSLAEDEPAEPVASVQVGQHPSETDCKQEAPGAPAQGTAPNSQPQVPLVPAPLKVAAAKESAFTMFSTPGSQKPSARPAQSFAIPLIRSKTGRLILPSSLRPAGQGIYRLMVMKPKQKGQEVGDSTSANMQGTDVDSKNQEKSLTASDQPSGSESGRVLEGDKASSNSDAKRSRLTIPLAELALLNKSLTVQAAENNQEGGTVVAGSKTRSAVTPNRVRRAPPPVTPEPEPGVVPRRRGRPRKNPVPLVSEDEKPPGAEETRKSIDESETSFLSEERQSEKKSPEATKRRAEDPPGMDSDAADTPVPVKRGRGRPPRKAAPVDLWSPAAREGNPCKSNRDSPVTRSCHLKSPDTKWKASPAATSSSGDRKTSRPLTRAALGKDFPSAKKRSWIDIEKELEPELESE